MNAVAPPAPGRILVGTSGYSFPDWVGPFYPPGTPSREFLRHYSGQFGCVEVNATYYRIPTVRTMASMVERTPPDFHFIVKVHQSVTHERRADAARDSAFQACLAPLRDSGKFHGLLAQFPWAFRRDEGAKAHLEGLRQLYADDPLWVEFRHDSWVHPRLASWLAERRLGYCAVDEPRLPGLMPGVAHLTTGVGYVRFHGRNSDTWWGGSHRSRASGATTGAKQGTDRYDYDYSEAELREWLERIRGLAQQAKQTYLFFNNCHAGQAARNARLMEELLRREQLAV